MASLRYRGLIASMSEYRYQATCLSLSPFNINLFYTPCSVHCLQIAAHYQPVTPSLVIEESIRLEYLSVHPHRAHYPNI